MNVIGYDPFISVENAWALSRSVQHAATMDAMLAQADYVTADVDDDGIAKALRHFGLIE